MAKALPFSNRIKEMRESKRLTQQDLADAIGMTRQTIVAIEKGKYSPSLEAAFRIAHTLGTNLEDVFLWQHQPA